MKKTKSEPQRYRICSDNDGHEYYIKVQHVDDFYKWVEYVENDCVRPDDGDYEGFRIDGRFTFTDPRNE
jgi:hypothetical protein